MPGRRKYDNEAEDSEDRASNVKDPTVNVQNLLRAAVRRQDDLRDTDTFRLHHDVETEVRRLDHDLEFVVKHYDEKFRDSDTKYQIQFNAAKEALNIALIAQDKQAASSLDGTKEAITKAEAATEKRFILLSEKIDGVSDTQNKNVSVPGLYVTHSDLSIEMEKLRTSFEGMLRPVITFMNTQTGQQKVSDPMMVTMVAELSTLSAAVLKSKSEGQGAAALWGWIVGGVMFVIAIASFLIPYLRMP